MTESGEGAEPRQRMASLSHLNERGEARMVDVGDKPPSRREAVAEGVVEMAEQTLRLIVEGGHKKGDVLTVARVAGIQAAKRCAELVPMCHALPLSAIEVDATPEPAAGQVRIRARCRTWARTGVEMEALTAVSVAALTVYDMCKAVDRHMVIGHVRLLEKTGGSRGDWTRAEAPGAARQAC